MNEHTSWQCCPRTACSTPCFLKACFPRCSEKPQPSCTFRANAEEDNSVGWALNSPQWLQELPTDVAYNRALRKTTSWVLQAITFPWTSPGGGASALHHDLNLQKNHTWQPLPRPGPSQGSHTGVMKYFLMEKEKHAKHMFRRRPLQWAQAARLHHCSLWFRIGCQKSLRSVWPKKSSSPQRSQQKSTSHLGNSYKKLQVYNMSCLDTWQVLSLPWMCGSGQHPLPLTPSYLEPKTSLPDTHKSLTLTTSTFRVPYHQAWKNLSFNTQLRASCYCSFWFFFSGWLD